ncbi:MULTISPECIES: IclR family transcriptional regulator [Chelativorans]|jgi:DNA-binding IclR family transcriptional regulator|uniref:Transcriptional regulator, IclR family n=1 Tax=Chelativorans sp. (strain BNC1) TaxID=266779 RepID=Q11FS2_CHESB|nr:MULTISPECIES: IclR family transcriptional regulator [Chelativorans]
MTNSQSLERALQILDLLDRANEPMGIREIARHIGLSNAIVQRLVNTFLEHGFVEQDRISRRYSIGYRAFSLGNSILRKDRMIVSAQRQLEMVASNHELNGYLGRRHGNQAVYLLCVQSVGPIAIRNSPGELAFLHSTAMGKVLLAALDDAEAEAILREKPLPKMTPATITDPDVIIKQVREAREAGYASVVEETILGVISVGAPVRNASGEVQAAMSVAFAERSSPHLTIDNVAPIVVAAADTVSRDLGWSPG